MYTMPRRHQAGSAFLIIMLAIAMFAALSYAVFRGSRQSMSSLTREQVTLAAQEIIGYGDAVQKAVQTLRLRGCTEEQLSFIFTGGNSFQVDGTEYDYSNPSATPDDSCEVFSPNGGRILPRKLKSGFIPSTGLPHNWMAPDSFIVTTTRVHGVGTENGSDLVMWVGRLQPEVCMKINDMLGVPNQSNLPPVDMFDCDGDIFHGTYSTCTNPIGDGTPVITGKSAFCSGYNASGQLYNYFVVLLAR